MRKMSNDTKAVSSVVLRDNILSQIKHAELYKTFREILTKKYKEKEQSFFNELWIAFSFKGQKGYWNKNVNGILVYEFPDAAKEIIQKKANGYKWEELVDEITVKINKAERWKADKTPGAKIPRNHQITALDNWEKNGR